MSYVLAFAKYDQDHREKRSNERGAATDPAAEFKLFL
jgi:hypothetical protein